MGRGGERRPYPWHRVTPIGKPGMASVFSEYS